MFDFKKNSQSTLPPTEINKIGQPPITNQASGVVPAVANEAEPRIYVMPEKFGGQEYKGKTISSQRISSGKILGFNKNVFFGVAIGILIIAILSLGGWFLLKSVEGPQTPVASNINANENQNNTLLTNEPVIPQCSSENCQTCSQEECLLLEGNCYWASVCGSEASTSTTCQNYLCLPGSATTTEENLILENGGEEELKLATDSDQDGLTDVEESLWLTDPLKADTDSDGYNDGAEVENLYDPLVAGSGMGSKLVDKGKVKAFINSQFGYSLYYPTAWQMETLGNEQDQIMFRINQNEFMEVIVQDNVGNAASAKEWYLSQFPDAVESELQEVLIGNWSGIASTDGLTVYLANKDHIYTLTYNIGLQKEITYQTTFKMMLKSFRLFENPL